jgi:hypothetical protein
MMAHSKSPIRGTGTTPAAWSEVGLTHPAIIEAFVNRRVDDASLLSTTSAIRYGDFFVDPS